MRFQTSQMSLKAGEIMEPQTVAVDEIGDFGLRNDLLFSIEEPIFHEEKSLAIHIDPRDETRGARLLEITRFKHIDFNVEIPFCIEKQPVMGFQRFTKTAQNLLDILMGFGKSFSHFFRSNDFLLIQ